VTSQSRARKVARRKPPRALLELIRISREVGCDPDLVQGGGGNTSVKSKDGRTMFVKASGTSLGQMDESHGWAELELDAARDLVNERQLLKLPSATREAQVLSRLQAMVHCPLGARPSVESNLHALLDRVVIHTHPVHLNTVLCARDSKDAYRKLCRGLDQEPLYLPYVDPGFVLAVRLADELRGYVDKHGRLPAVVLLENHGVFVSHRDVGPCLKLSAGVTRLGTRRAGTARVNPLTVDWTPSSGRRASKGRTRSSSSSGGSGEAKIAEVRGALLRGGVSPTLVQLDASDLARRFATNRDAVKLARRGAFTPDQIVYCRTYPLVLSGANPDAWQKAVARYRERYQIDPRVILRPGVGVYYAVSNLVEMQVVAEVYRSAMITILSNQGGAGPRFLTRRKAAFIEGWEVEAFRAQLLSGSAKRLVGRVALVTGAASGLGLGIARGLIDAGAVVIAGDIDSDLLAKTSQEFSRGTYLPCLANVTDEDSVAAAFRAAESLGGGLDILVNAAGIAPSFPLVDFPIGAWQRTLDLNLTGYFLCAREAARLLLRQNAGGSIINVTSKSGLEASKSNSAYNATKAGEIHLMRGWALELGPHGVRVNCIAPGNVFKGSKIWNETYIRSAAKKKGIRPEEVIPYYTSLSPLGQEIEPDDVASGVLYLVSDEGRKVSGQTLVVDGGQVMVR